MPVERHVLRGTFLESSFGGRVSGIRKRGGGQVKKGRDGWRKRWRKTDRHRPQTDTVMEPRHRVDGVTLELVLLEAACNYFHAPFPRTLLLEDSECLRLSPRRDPDMHSLKTRATGFRAAVPAWSSWKASECSRTHARKRKKQAWVWVPQRTCHKLFVNTRLFTFPFTAVAGCF